MRISLMLLVALALTTGAVGADKKKIVLVAGHKSHGYGSHEFNAGCLLLEKGLNEGLGDPAAIKALEKKIQAKKAFAQRARFTQEGLKKHKAEVAALEKSLAQLKSTQVETEVYRSGWPKESNAFDGADAIILYMDGGGRHPVLKNMEQIGKLMGKGVGLMCMHYGVEIPKGQGGEAFKNWIGGYYESGFSINPHWSAKAKLNTGHAITNGVKPFDVRDEWYFNMRFRDGHKGVTNILQAVPDDEARSGKTSWPRGPKKHIVESSGRTETLLWAVERKDGGRGVGFTGGHFHWNWGEPNHRKLVLNAIYWVAGGEVPKDGIAVSKLTLDDLKTNQDFKPKKNFKYDKIEADLKKWNK